MRCSYNTKVLLFSALLMLVMGCRRESATPQPPLPVVNEKSDFLTTFSEADLMKKLRVEKKLPLDLSWKEPYPPEVLDPATEIREPQEANLDENLVKTVRERVTKAREKRLLEIQIEEIRELAGLFISFVDKHKESQRTFDNFKGFVRRARKLELKKMLENNVFAVGMEAEMADPTHVILYRLNPHQDLGNMYVTTANKFGYGKSEDLAIALKKQQVWMTRKGYMQYTAGAAAGRSHDDLKKFLKTNWYPSIGAEVEGGTILVTDPAAPGPWIAGFAKAEGGATALVINAGGYGQLDEKMMPAVFPKR